MRKTSSYARKLRRLGGTFNGAEYLNVIERSRGYTDPAVPELGVHCTEDAAVKALVRVKTALVTLTSGATPPGNEEHYDLLAHALGVSCMRAGQIGGPEVDSNAMLPPLVAGNDALRQVLARRRRWGKWQVLPAEAEVLGYAVEIYETILLASSPQQMVDAVDMRLRALRGQTLETVTP